MSEILKNNLEELEKLREENIRLKKLLLSKFYADTVKEVKKDLGCKELTWSLTRTIAVRTKEIVDAVIEGKEKVSEEYNRVAEEIWKIATDK